MKSFALATLIAALLAAGTAQAGGDRHGGYYGGNGGYHGGHGYGHGYPYGRGYYYAPYRGAYYGYPYYYGHHNNNNNSNSSVAYALGGLVLGSILTNVYYQNRAPAYVQQTYPQPARVAAPQGRHLVRDLNGNCFERTTDAAGNELRTELPPGDCNW